MIKRVNCYFLFLVFLLFSGCSLDKKTGMWDGYEKQKERINFLRKERQKLSNTVNIYSTQDFVSQEIPPKKAIVLSPPEKNSSWKMSGYNLQNDVGHKYLPSITNQFLKKELARINSFDQKKYRQS